MACLNYGLSICHILYCHLVRAIETNNSACLIIGRGKKEEIGGDGLHGRVESIVWIPASMAAAVLLSPRKLETKIVVDKVIFHAIHVITLSATKPVVSCFLLGAGWILSARIISVPLYAQNAELIFHFCQYDVDYPFRIISACHTPLPPKPIASATISTGPSDAVPPSFCAMTSCKRSLISV